MMDPYADASIGNVTGSNSVNVFLGIGLAWGLSAFYWEIIGPSDAAKEEYKVRLNADSMKNKNVYGTPVHDKILEYVDPDKDEKLVFMTPAGTIYFNLAGCFAAARPRFLWLILRTSTAT